MKFENNSNNSFKKLFNSLLAQNGIDLATIAPNHCTQNTDNTILDIVKQANELASGNTQDSTQTNQTTGWQKFQKIRMVSILEKLGKLDDKKIFDKIYEYHLPITELSLTFEKDKDNVIKTETFFPQKVANTAAQDYTKLWEGFTKEVKQIVAFTDFKVFAETLLNLLHKYAITVPSSTHTSLQDISLYDHIKVATAISVCLYDYAQEAPNKEDNQENKKADKPFMLIGADISGIQSFLYDIISSKAAKNLKGRSFYLQLLTDSIVEKVISELKLFSANVIYASGGNFFVLAPNTDTVKKQLDALEKEITDKLFAEHKTTLGFIMDFVEISKAEITGNTLGKTWQSLYDKLDVKKKQKNKLQMLSNEKLLTAKNGYDFFFTPSEIGGIAPRDMISNEELDINNANKKGEILFFDEESKDINDDATLAQINAGENLLSKNTHEQIRLGEVLKNVVYHISSQKSLSEILNVYEFNPCNLGIYHYFIAKEDFFKNDLKSAINQEKTKISVINDLDFIVNFNNTSSNFNFYGGNKFPKIKVKIKQKYEKTIAKTFSEMAGMKEKEVSYIEEFLEPDLKKLAILRMDVDNLGSLFKDGFNIEKTQEKDENGRNIYKSIATFSRLASLSRNLDYFFKGFLNVIWNSKADYKNYTQIIYSGGDDLFIVGRWNCIIDFAEDIQTHFAEWTCNNEEIGISGGITVVTPKFPISKAAELCEIDEKLAKNHKISESIEKNAITLFGVPLHWKYEFPIVKKLKNRLVAMDMPKSILMKIQAFYQQAQEEQKKNKTQTWRWQMAYNFARAATQYKNNIDLLELLSEIKIDIIADTVNKNKVVKKHDYFTLLNLAARWAEFELRSQK
jgi:CRISPR-associated protein Csm1